MRPATALLLLSWILLVSAAPAEQVDSSPEEPPAVTIDEVQITARIDGRQLALALDFEARTKQADQGMQLIQGEAVLQQLDQGDVDYRLDYAPEGQAYRITWPRKGVHGVSVAFMARSETDADGSWRQSRVQVPCGDVRRIRLLSDRPNLEVALPGAMRVERRVQEGQLVITAILGPHQPLIVRWKPQVQLADAKLVLSSVANTIVDVRAGVLHLDAVYDFQVAQGKIETLVFAVPAGLNIMSLDGDHIRTWTLTDATEGVRQLVVEMSRPQADAYRLCVRAETRIKQMPAEIEVPAIEPAGAIRAGGHLAVGTDSALQLVVLESSGLTQIDAAIFPHVQGRQSQERRVPEGKAFFYVHAGSHYRLRLSADDIVPSYDVAGRVVATVKEDDLVVDAELELDVRDAPVRQLEVAVPAGMIVASVAGTQVEDYHLSDAPMADASMAVGVVFSKPVIGRTLVTMRLELGKGPLGARQRLSALRVTGAKSHRGYVVVASEPGVEIQDVQVEELREVHTASVPLHVARTQFAYRFREPNWTLTLLAQSKPAGIRAEVFHLESIGETLAYGSAVVNYVITGSPVDELSFRLPDGLENVEFIGADVRSSTRQDGVWVVKLTRKVIGDYSLAMTCTQRYGPDQPIELGSLYCRDVQTQTGYVVVTSFLDLKLQVTPVEAADTTGLLAITMDEVPGDYRLLTDSPILAAYKYVTDSHKATMHIDSYRRSELLSVMLDIVTHQTKLAIRPNGQIESATTVRYKVKNAAGQFLSLDMPEGTRVWTVSRIEEDSDGQEKVTRLALSYDAQSGRLLVPLIRKANPNEPTTIQIEYGKVHQSQGRWRRRLDLAAPGCVAPIAYADWRISVPDEWAITPAGGNMRAQPRQDGRVGLAHVLSHIGRLWNRALDRWVGRPMVWVAEGLALVLTVLCVLLRRRWLPEWIVAMLLIAAVWIGGQAALSGDLDEPMPMTSLDLGQAVNADPNEALQVSAVLTPAWRYNITRTEAIVVPALVVAALAVALLRRRLWWVALSAGLVASAYLAAKMPVTWPVLKALMTWGTPAAISVVLIVRMFARHRHVLPATTLAAVSLIAVLMSPGCALSGGGEGGSVGRPTIERIGCRLAAGDDNIELQYKLRVLAGGPARFPLLDDSAVLISRSDTDPHVAIRAEDGMHTVRVDKPGAYDVEATFLAPLTEAGQDQQRRFELPLPVALTNRIVLAIPDANVAIDALQAVQFVQREQDDSTEVEAMFAPGRPAVFTWRPKERQTAQEQVRFYARDVALVHAGAGTLQAFHAVRLQIAQGQIDTLKIGVASGETVTSVIAPDMGSWRFDPTTHQLEVRLARPATGIYELTLTTQAAGASAPYDMRLEPLTVRDAANQQSMMGLSAEPSVFVRLDQHPASMNVRDYIRDATDLIKTVSGLTVEEITHAFRFDTSADAVTGTVQAVQSELRSEEVARFNAEDDRLVYNSQWVVEITKAGRFDVVLQVPSGYDIDALEGEQVSHWDESIEADRRLVRVHFKRKVTGSIPLKLTLSRPVAQMPERLDVPRVMLDDALKHRGHLVVGSEQGVRLSVASRQGVSEVNPAELGHSNQGFLAFRLLRADWQLELEAELIEPRITVQSLHVAKVTEGLVRHHHYLRYRLFHAGVKAFEVVVPPEAVGVTLTGSGIARREELEQGRWRIELADKVYDQPYLLRVAYETQYDQADGTIVLAPVRCTEADLQQGHIVVFATDRVELSANPTDASLRPAEARNIEKYFGAGDLFGAAMCYRTTSPDHALTVGARRHAAAEQVGADVRRTEITTVVTETGQAITRVNLILRVGSRRHLQAVLPQAATLWSLSVEGQAAQPSIRAGADGRESLLVPLPQETSDDVIIDMVYVAGLASAQGAGRVDQWPGSRSLTGPRFDLPLKQITWRVYVPEGYHYDDFEGTLSVDKRSLADRRVHRYDLGQYERQLLEAGHANDRFAQQQQSLAHELAQQGRQGAARRALTKGYNFSIGNMALNEDIRVDLDNLLQQQAKVGLVNARGRLRRQALETAVEPMGELIIADGQGVNFDQAQAERIESSLGQADSRNLELITRRIIQAQEAAEASVAQLQVTMPICGRLLCFDSPLQVEPQAAMTVAFHAARRRTDGLDSGLRHGVVLFVGLLAAGGGAGFVRRRWSRLHEMLTPASRPSASTESTPANDANGPVSADELI